MAQLMKAMAIEVAAGPGGGGWPLAQSLTPFITGTGPGASPGRSQQALAQSLVAGMQAGPSGPAWSLADALALRITGTGAAPPWQQGTSNLFQALQAQLAVGNPAAQDFLYWLSIYITGTGPVRPPRQAE